MTDHPEPPCGDAICFGLNRPTDERSLRLFLKMFSDDALLGALLPRLTDGEIAGLVQELTGILRRHLSEDEYHRLFLKH